MQEWLRVSSIWRCASILFASPSRGATAELASLAPSLPVPDRETVNNFAAFPFDEWETEYHRVLGPAGIPCCESSYEENALAGRGPVLAMIAGYYEAFAYRPDPAVGETPDHLSVELGFLSFLALKIAFALHEGRDEERQIALEAYEKFLGEHPGHWMDRLAEKISEAGSPLFEPAARWLQQIGGL